MSSLYTQNDSKRPYDESLIEEPIPDYIEFRNPWRQDFGRIVHSHAFRRLQGKTQLFPGFESDFFRNRLTHSLEVAQIAKSIALSINYNKAKFKAFPIDTDLVEVASLAHDIGHPPFGHNGEEALFELMKDYGGFEGNAQTLRLLTKIEKKVKENNTNLLGIDDHGTDRRHGLNLTFRSLASVLKYNNRLGERLHKFQKGYYISEAPVVDSIIKAVTGVDNFKEDFKTIECYIMDIADDIAYATYDLEDAFKSNLLSPFDLLEINDDLAGSIASELSEKYGYKATPQDIKIHLQSIYLAIFGYDSAEGLIDISRFLKITDGKNVPSDSFYKFIKSSYNLAKSTCEDGYKRTRFTSRLIKIFIDGVDARFNPKIPALSVIKLDATRRIMVETLKRLSFELLINSPRIRITAIRGKEIVKAIFTSLDNGVKSETPSNPDKGKSAEDVESKNGSEESGARLSPGKGYMLLPEDYRDLFLSVKTLPEKKRVICDYIAGMTDRYALEFYGRLKSENPETIFKGY